MGITRQTKKPRCKFNRCASLPGVLSRLIGDRAYDSDPLNTSLAWRGIEMIASTRITDAGQARRYKGRRKADHPSAVGGSLRASTGYYLGFIKLASVIVLLQRQSAWMGSNLCCKGFSTPNGALSRPGESDSRVLRPSIST